MSDLISSFVRRVMGPVKSFQGSAAVMLQGAASVTRCAFATLRRLISARLATNHRALFTASERRLSPEKATSFATTSGPRPALWPSGNRALPSPLATPHSPLATDFFSPPPRATGGAAKYAALAVRFCAVFLLLYTLSPITYNLAVSQTTSAGVSGRITDPSGAVVVDAEVEIKNTDTNDSITVKTNGDGLYNIPSLKPGHYLINVRKAGFRSVTVTEVELNIQDNVVRNFALQVGSISETVTINGNDLHINTTDATVGTVIDQSYVKNMPLNGRSFQDLILLTPGTVTQPSQMSAFAPRGGSGLGVTGEFSVNGQRAESNYYTVDGVSANVGAAPGYDMTAGGAGASGSIPGATALGTTQALVSVDALQEFRVQSSTYSAEYGRNPGGQFAFETKSGTNQWHGTAYEYLRNGALDAKDWFNDYFGLPEPPIKQNDFGGTLGGPVRIPRLYNGKDKTFFFVSYEGLRLTAPQPASTNFVPDLALRASAPAPLNQVLNAFPVPNGSEVLVPCDPATDPSCPSSGQKQNGLARFTASWSNPSSLDSTGVRFDHVVNDKLRLFFRFGDTASSSASRGTAAANQKTPSLEDVLAYTFRTYTGGVNSMFSSRLNNEFRLNYTSNAVDGNTIIDAFGGSTPVDLRQLVGFNNPGSAVHLWLFFPGENIPFGLRLTPQSGDQRQWNFVDTLNLSLGHHQFKFGADYRRLAPFATVSTPLMQYFYFDESAINANRTTFSFVDVLAPRYPLYANFSAFAQDAWRVSQRLSLSMGLRWEVNPAPGVTQGLKPYTLQGAGPDTWSLAPQGTPLWHTTWYNFAPRLGVAYILNNALGRETVVRGGGGVFFDTGQQMGSMGFSGPGFLGFKFLGSTAFPGNPISSLPTITNPPVPPYDGAPVGFSSHLQLPYTLQWNASIEQALGKSQALTISYVGSRASRLLQFTSFSSATNPNAGFFQYVLNGLSSDYGSLQIQFRRRLSRGLTALGSYSWSHCLDYGSFNYTLGYQRGNCNFDVRNNLSAALSYDLPNVGRNRFMNAMLHHWGLDDRFTARTAFPVDLVGNAVVDPATGRQLSNGLDFVAGEPIYLYGANCSSTLQALGDLAPGQGCPGGRAINPNAFMSVSSGFGNTPRNFARGFGAWQLDMAVRRDFPIYENLKLQFRAEAFNIFNHPNLGFINPFCGGAPGVPGCSNPQFGQATATLAGSLGVLNPLYQMGGPRSMQFALKLVF